jgi:hypothetical protein
MDYKIKCRFCQVELGTFRIDNPMEGITYTDADVGIDDTRCESCAVSHGTFNDMKKEFDQKVGGTYAEFMALFAQAEYKATNFSTLCDEIVLSRLPPPEEP